MPYKNLTLFRMPAETLREVDRLDEEASSKALAPCGPQELARVGFVPPIRVDGATALTHQVNDAMFVNVGMEEKILPGSVVSDELQRRLALIAQETGRKPGARERKQLKEEVLFDLLGRAFTRRTHVGVCLDKSSSWCVIDTSSRKKAENAVALIREALGSFPATPPAPDESPRVLMTDWLAKGNGPEGFVIGDECELRDPVEGGGRWRGRRAELTSDDVKEHLKAGFQVFQLGLVFEDRLAFVLGEDLVIRKFKFLDLALDEIQHVDGEDAAVELDAQFTLFSAEVRRLLARLEGIFGMKQKAA